MNWCRETTKMVVPRAAQALAPRAGQPSRVPRDWFPYLNGTSQGPTNGTSQGPTPEDARKDGHIRGRSKLFMKYPG
jgi:hypothetical protein